MPSGYHVLMKIKCQPDDFQVDELTDFTPTGGPFSLFRMTKRSLGTPEAIEVIGRKWNINRPRLSYGGLKDKHAVTTQYVTIDKGPRRDMHEVGVQLDFLGFAPRAFGPHDISGNRFTMVIRDLTEPALEGALTAAKEVAQEGLPNYFDDQRFGSVGFSGEFIAAPWCLGDYERALWLALADPNEDDRASEKEQKRILREMWGQWPECKAALERSHRRSLITFLADRPGDFKGAFARLNVDLRGLYLSAFQSHLWNILLASLLRRECPERLVDVPLKMGPFPFLRSVPGQTLPPLPPTLTEAELPLPCARMRHEAGVYEQPLEALLEPYGLSLQKMRPKYPRDSFFSKGVRAAIVNVRGLTAEPGDDELYSRKKKLTLKFDLPRGAYATILVKRITGES